MKCKLIQGDCNKKMRQLPKDSVHLVVTSPPYDNLRTYNDSLSWNEKVWKAVLTNIHRVLTENGVCVWIVNDAVIDGGRTGTSFRQALYWKDELGGFINDVMIWQKPGFSHMGGINRRYLQVYEYMHILTKGTDHTFNCIKDRKNLSPSGKSYLGSTKRLADGSIVNTRKKKQQLSKSLGGRFNLWLVQPETSMTSHPAPYPVKLARDHIKTWSNKDDTVLDPFMGSGTTGVACKLLGRNFIGIEKEPKYFKISKSRIRSTIEPLTSI